MNLVKIKSFFGLLLQMFLFFGCPFLVLGSIALIAQGWSFFWAKFDTLMFLVTGVVFAMTLEKYRHIKF